MADSVMEKEELILEKISSAWRLFYELESQHPDELKDFKEGIHKCQSVIALRFAREYRPDIFPKKARGDV